MFTKIIDNDCQLHLSEAKETPEFLCIADDFCTEFDKEVAKM